MTHTFPIRIYYEDTDAGGVVYHANYLKFTERARTEFLRENNLECSKIEQDLGVLFVVRHIDADFIKPLQLDDKIEVRTTPYKTGKASFVLQQDVYKNDAVVFESRVTLVTVNAQTLRPIPLPDKVRNILN